MQVTLNTHYEALLKNKLASGLYDTANDIIQEGLCLLGERDQLCELKDESLYHYTNLAGLLGILESNCLWATHYKFLNDYSELSFAKDELRKSLINTKNFNFFYNRFLEYEIYTLSLCDKKNTPEYIQNNGLLSQWRGYGEDGGFAIVFDKKKLEIILEEENKIGEKNFEKGAKEKPKFFGRNIVYSNEIYLGGFEKEINEINNILGDESQGEADKMLDKFIESWIKCISFYKSEGFKEESEYRVVASLGRTNKNPHKKREFTYDKKPYIKLFEEMDALPIQKIIVGPHKDKEKRAVQLEVQLSQLGRGDIEISISKIPFIG